MRRWPRPIPVGNGTGQERHGPTAAADGADRIISKSQPKNLRPLPGGGGGFEAKYWSKSETGPKRDWSKSETGQKARLVKSEILVKKRDWSKGVTAQSTMVRSETGQTERSPWRAAGSKRNTGG